MTDRHQFRFSRPRLADRLVDRLMGRDPFSLTSGLFLAAPRRTGKSTFLREDLVPALRREGVRTIYVDLWADRARDPAELIAEAVRAELRGLAPAPVRAARFLGVARLAVSGVSLDLGHAEAPVGATLTQLLAALASRAESSVALILDEAQQALSTEGGLQSMFALKAARDALNQGEAAAEGPLLLLVFTGSYRDKLAQLVLKRDQPFFGAEVTDFPRLGRDYALAYAEWVNARLLPERRVSGDAVHAAFDLLGQRPEFLQRAVNAAVLGGGPETLIEEAERQRDAVWDEYRNLHESLSPLARAVLARLIGEGDAFAPFTAASLAAYGEVLGRAVTTNEVQSALSALREENVVWRSARGVYTLDDQEMAEWFQGPAGPGSEAAGVPGREGEAAMDEGS